MVMDEEFLCHGIGTGVSGKLAPRWYTRNTRMLDREVIKRTLFFSASFLLINFDDHHRPDPLLRHCHTARLNSTRQLS